MSDVFVEVIGVFLLEYIDTFKKPVYSSSREHLVNGRDMILIKYDEV
jgi:hypothetical protein